MRIFIALALLAVFTFTITGCQSQRKVRRLASKVDSVDEALKLETKYPKWDMVIHELDSQAFFSHPVYSRLRPGILTQIGQEDSQGADLYKLIAPDQTLNNTNGLHYYVVQFHLK